MLKLAISLCDSGRAVNLAGISACYIIQILHTNVPSWFFRVSLLSIGYSCL